MKSALDWFEIPATDIERAARFYGQIYDTEMAIDEVNPGY